MRISDWSSDVCSSDLRGLVDDAKNLLGSGVAVLVAVNEGRASVAVGVTQDLVATHSAVDLVKSAVAALGGQGGGGRPDMAQGGGPEGDKAQATVQAVRQALAQVAAAACSYSWGASPVPAASPPIRRESRREIRKLN